MERRKLFLDYDGCIVNTILAITEMYNDDFQYYKDYKPIGWWDVMTWDFEELKCVSKEYINTYFNQKRFFDKIRYMPDAYETICELNKYYDITIVSTGYSPNLKGKKLWVKEHLPFCEFIGINLKEYSDKSHIDMSGNGNIFIDDSANNLITSNCENRICFGEVYPWNEDWTGTRIKNWEEILGGLKTWKKLIV